ncbi:MAG: ABC transporter permease [Planctomycetota bacterium]
MYFELIIESMKNLARHKLRSFLTALGIIFGIASVMSMVSTGEGAKREILSQIGELGIRNIIINAKKPPVSDDVRETSTSRVLRYGLTFRDADQIRKTLPTVVRVLPVHDVKQWIWFKSRRLEAKVRGVTPEYFETLNLKVFFGRALSEVDALEQRRVCVVRAGLLRQARYLGDPLKLDLRIGTQFYRVVGLLPDYAFHSPNKAVLGIDDRALEVYVPFESVISRFGLESFNRQSGSSERTRVELNQIVCQVESKEEVLQTARCIKAIMKKFHPKKDYQTTVPLELLESSEKTQKVFNLVLPIIAGISLLVGGIGVLNIMLASITERTREIGIRRAIGATRLDITAQFLVETVTLTVVGGIIGVGVGIGGTYILERVTGWDTVVTPWAVTLSLGISCVTGVLFGLYPARRAAMMDPITALGRE